MLDRAGLFIRRGCDLHILWNVNNDRAGAARCRNVKGLMNDIAQPVGRLHKVIMLRAMARDANRIGFLKRITADQVCCHLPSYDNHRDGIHQGVGNARHGIGRTGARCHKHNAGFPRRAGIAFGRMGGRLFVAHKNVANALLLKQGIINGENRPARIAKNHLNAEIAQRFDEDIGA